MVEESLQPHAFVTNRWSRTILQPLLISILVLALSIALLVVLNLLFQGLPWLVLSGLSFVVGLEGVLTTYWLAQPNQRLLNKYAYRTAEFGIIFIVTRFFTWLLFGDIPATAELLDYVRRPLLVFDSLFFVLALVIVFLGWQTAITAATIFKALAIDRAEVSYYTLPKRERNESNRPIGLNRGYLINLFFQQWIWGGVLLVFCAALTTFNLGAGLKGGLLAMNRLGLQPAMLLALLLYFSAGFLLISQGRLAAMNARWLAAGFEKNKRVEKSWQRSSAWLLLLVGLGAAFLPIGSTFAIARILEVVLYGIYVVITLILSLLTSLLMSVLSLFGSRPSENNMPGLFDLSGLEPPQATPPTEAEPSLFVGSFFWLVIILLAAAALIFFLNERGVSLRLGRVRHIWYDFVAWWRMLWQVLTGQLQEAQYALRQRLSRPPAEEAGGAKAPWRFVRLNALSPREQIRYFYLSTVRRAGEQGVRREESETPVEYEADLKAVWPEAEREIDALTAAFLRARYSRQAVEADEVSAVKPQWKQVKSRLRKRKRAVEADEEEEAET